jgi:hypothetical protein
MVDYNNLMDYMEQLDPDELIEVMNDVQKVNTHLEKFCIVLYMINGKSNYSKDIKKQTM